MFAEKSVLYDKITNMDIVLMLMRHIQYHTGHCDSILREDGFEAVEWLDYLETGSGMLVLDTG